MELLGRRWKVAMEERILVYMFTDIRRTFYISTSLIVFIMKKRMKMASCIRQKITI